MTTWYNRLTKYQQDTILEFVYAFTGAMVALTVEVWVHIHPSVIGPIGTGNIATATWWYL